jgi:hypothetical protein
VISVDVVEMDAHRLQQEVLALRQRTRRLIAFLRLLTAVLKVSEVSLVNARLPDGAKKFTLLRAINRTIDVLPLPVSLRAIGLSAARYHLWKREKVCGLDDSSSCPQSSPQQLTSAEGKTIEEMLTSDDSLHAK